MAAKSRNGKIMGKLDGKVAIVTGAARGMGAAHSRRLAAEGANVILADVLDAEGKTVAEEIGASALYKHLDVRSEADWRSAIALATERFGRLDILVNNSGILRFGRIGEIPIEEFRSVMDVNLMGTVLGVSAAIAPMTHAGGGSIVNIASVNGLAGSPGISAYVASKHAIVGFTKSAAMELAAVNIRVNAVCPGAVLTPLAQAVSAEIGADAVGRLARSVPMGRRATPEEIANLVTFLASDESSYCTGTQFVADGGLLTGFTLG